jgi:hypothetical protein
MANSQRPNKTMMRRRHLLILAALPVSGHARTPPASPTGPVVLTVGKGATFDMATLARMKQHTIRTATPWYDRTREFTGPLLRDVLSAAGVPADVRGMARFVALNDYRVEIPLEDAREHDVIVARLLDGQPMSVRQKGPLFVMYPFDDKPALRSAVNFGRCVWQLKAIELP